MRGLLLLLVLLPAPAWAADSIALNGLCVGPMRVERSKGNPAVIEVYCAIKPGAEPALRLAQCPAPTQITTEGNRKTIRCPGGTPVIVTSK